MSKIIDKISPDAIPTNQIPDVSLYPVINEEINKMNEKVQVLQKRINQQFIDTDDCSPDYPTDKNFKGILCGENVTYFIDKTIVKHLLIVLIFYR